MGFIFNFLVTGLTFYIAAKFISSVYLKNFLTAVMVAVVIAVANAFLSIFIPSTMATQGVIGYFLVNAVLIKIADYFLDGFKTNGFVGALILSVVVTLVSWGMSFLTLGIL